MSRTDPRAASPDRPPVDSSACPGSPTRWRSMARDAPAPGPAPVKASYDAWASTYDADRNRTRDLDGEVTRKVLGELAFRTVVEIGCGTGKNTDFLAARAERILALDFSPRMLGVAREKVVGRRCRRAGSCSRWRTRPTAGRAGTFQPISSPATWSSSTSPTSPRSSPKRAGCSPRAAGSSSPSSTPSARSGHQGTLRARRRHHWDRGVRPPGRGVPGRGRGRRLHPRAAESWWHAEDHEQAEGSCRSRRE